MCLLTGIFHDVDAKLDNVPGTDLEGLRLRCRLAKALIIDEGAIAAACVLEEEFPVAVPQYGMISGKDFTIEDGICLGHFIPGHCTTNLYFYIWLQIQRPILCWEMGEARMLDSTTTTTTTTKTREKKEKYLT